MAINKTLTQTGIGQIIHDVNQGQNKITVESGGNTFQVLGYSQPPGTPNRLADVLWDSRTTDVNGTVLKGYQQIVIDITAGAFETKSLAVSVNNGS